jgi:putative transposase
LAAILDACSRRVVGYAIALCMNVRLRLAALRAAIRGRRPGLVGTHHSVRGSQQDTADYRDFAHSSPIHRPDDAAGAPDSSERLHRVLG